MQKNRFAIFKLKGKGSYDPNVTVFTIFWTADPFGMKVGLWYYKSECL